MLALINNLAGRDGGAEGGPPDVAIPSPRDGPVCCSPCITAGDSLLEAGFDE